MNVVETLDRPALPVRLRVPAAALFGVAVIALVTLSVAYGGKAYPGRVDIKAFHAVARIPVGKPFANHVANLGGPKTISVFVIVLTAGLLLLRRMRGAAVAAISVPAAVVITEWVLKPLIGRSSNIYSPLYSFPSGHTTSIFAVAFAAVLVLCDRQRPLLNRVASVIVGAAFLGLAGCVALGQVFTGRHYATDTIGGFLVALSTVIAVAFVVDYAADLWLRTRGRPRA